MCYQPHHVVTPKVCRRWPVIGSCWYQSPRASHCKGDFPSGVRCWSPSYAVLVSFSPEKDRRELFCTSRCFLMVLSLQSQLQNGRVGSATDGKGQDLLVMAKADSLWIDPPITIRMGCRSHPCEMKYIILFIRVCMFLIYIIVFHVFSHVLYCNDTPGIHSLSPCTDFEAALYSWLWVFQSFCNSIQYTDKEAYQHIHMQISISLVTRTSYTSTLPSWWQGLCEVAFFQPGLFSI